MQKKISRKDAKAQRKAGFKQVITEVITIHKDHKDHKAHEDRRLEQQRTEAAEIAIY